jgi:hypothetical protein
METLLHIDIDYDLLASKVADVWKNQMLYMQPVVASERKKIRGIRSLAAYLGCSPSKAQAIKNSGRIPFYESGGLLYFFSDEIDAALRKGGEK